MSLRRRFRGKSAVATAVVACTCAILVVGVVVRSHGWSDAQPTAGAPPGERDPRLMGHRFAECLRRHGHPEIADPALTPDGLNFGTQSVAVKEATRALRGTACRRELTALKPLPDPPTPAELRRAVQFSRCMRQHGVPDWPDPHPDGTYPLNQRLQQAGKAGIGSALEACRHLNPDAGIAVSASADAPAKKT
jgi:hypothetical protein